MTEKISSYIPIIVFVCFIPVCYGIGYLATGEHLIIVNYLAGMLILALFVAFPALVASLFVDDEDADQ